MCLENGGHREKRLSSTSMACTRLVDDLLDVHLSRALARSGSAAIL